MVSHVHLARVILTEVRPSLSRLVKLHSVDLDGNSPLVFSSKLELLPSVSQISKNKVVPYAPSQLNF